MKTAVSVPDELFREADALARQLGLNRSQLYSKALQEYMSMYTQDPVTASWDAVADDLDMGVTAGEVECLSLEAARDLIDRGEWEH